MPRIGRAALAGLLLIGGTFAVSAEASAASSCPLSQPSSKIKHIVFMQFDNLHLERDNPNVPSDLEQIPSLMNFLTTKGFLSGNDHTVHISHTANGFLTTAAGVYSDRLGTGISNSFLRYSSTGTTSSQSDFVYWTDTVPGTNVPVLINENGVTAPAPWPAFTKAGCDVGVAGIADTILENTTTDITTVFGANSPQAAEAKANPAQAVADFEGVAIHCAKKSPLCNTPNAAPDALPAQPGGYNGFQALFGHVNAIPAITKNLPLVDLNGVVISDGNGHIGFPGFDGMEAAVSLAYGATMLEAGVPVITLYGSDVHDGHGALSDMGLLGPGSVNDEVQDKEYEAAFATFFARLKADGIDETNTLFIFTVDESDHFVGGPPSPANCDGVTVVCTYPIIGEVDADVGRLVSTQRGNTTPFKVHSDSVPIVYITGNPAQTDPVSRQLEQDMLAIQVTDLTNNQAVPLANAAIDQAGMGFLHMLATDTLRNPTFSYYQNADFFGFTTGSSSCNTGEACVTLDTGFAYNHGDFQKDIRTTWVGMAGPGVVKAGLTNAVWSDHTDVRPTILALAGIKSDYMHDGRVLFEFLKSNVLPAKAQADVDGLIALATLYKQITAPFSDLSIQVLGTATRGLNGTPEIYNDIQERLNGLTLQRNVLAGEIKQVLDDAEFSGKVKPAQVAQLTLEAQLFLNFAKAELAE